MRRLLPLVLLLTLTAPAAAQQITVTDGKSQPVFDYNQAIRERVYIPQPGIDQDNDLAPDDVAVEIIRPKQSGPNLKVPAIIDPSPYFTTVCRGNESQCIGDSDNDGINDRWPLFLGKYFVPRGYAYVLAEANGTGNGTGCPLHGGPGDVAGEKSVIDWLNGRVPGYAKPGGAAAVGNTPIAATWHNGKAAMIGKSYDGTFANGVAATGVEGLTTIVPISAISSWYKYSRMGGIRFNTGYPATLSNGVTNPDRQPVCAPTLATLTAQSDDANGDVNAFWKARDYLKDVAKVKAAVFEVHGLQDDNVKMDNMQPWWDGLKAAGVPRKLWLIREGHVDPFDSRRAVWVDTLHRWFDHWLLDVDNGIMTEPRVTIEDAKDTWGEYADWPLPGTRDTSVFLQGVEAGKPGVVGLKSGGATPTLQFTDSATQSEATMMSTPGGSQANRLVFLSNTLTQPLRLSGTPKIDMTAALSTTQSNLGALIVDYGPGTPITRTSEGIANTTMRTCWGQHPTSASDWSECYLEVSKPTVSVTAWRMSRGILDSSNRDSLETPTTVTPGTPTKFAWPLIPNDYVFAKDHQIGVVLVGDYSGLGMAGTGTPNSTITVDTKVSEATFPVVGGYPAAVASGAFVADATAPALNVSPDVAIDATGSDGAAVDYAAPSATDDEDPAPTASCDPASGSTFAAGMTTVTCSGRDATGNTTTKTFTVTVRPQATPPASPTTVAPTDTPAATATVQPTGAPAAMPSPTPPASVTVPAALPPIPTAVVTAGPETTPPPTLDAPGDATAPRVTHIRVRHRGHRIRTRLRTSEAGTVTIVVARHGSVVRRITRRVGPGTHRFVLRSHRVRRHRHYAVAIRVRDAAGNTTRLRVHR